jgi:hypothetical protein
LLTQRGGPRAPHTLPMTSASVIVTCQSSCGAITAVALLPRRRLHGVEGAFVIGGRAPLTRRHGLVAVVRRLYRRIGLLSVQSQRQRMGQRTSGWSDACISETPVVRACIRLSAHIRCTEPLAGMFCPLRQTHPSSSSSVRTRLRRSSSSSSNSASTRVARMSRASHAPMILPLAGGEPPGRRAHSASQQRTQVSVYPIESEPQTRHPRGRPARLVREPAFGEQGICDPPLFGGIRYASGE